MAKASDNKAISERKLLSLVVQLMNIEKQTLIENGIIPTGDGGKAWKQFNSDPLAFIVSLNQQKRQRLLKLIEGTEKRS